MIMAKRENAFGKFLNYIEDKYKTTADDEAEDFGAKPKNLKQSRKRAKKFEDFYMVLSNCKKFFPDFFL